MGEEGAKALPARAPSLDDNGVIRQPAVAVAPDRFAQQHGPDHAILVADGGQSALACPAPGPIGPVCNEPRIQRPGPPRPGDDPAYAGWGGDLTQA